MQGEVPPPPKVLLAIANVFPVFENRSPFIPQQSVNGYPNHEKARFYEAAKAAFENRYEDTVSFRFGVITRSTERGNYSGIYSIGLIGHASECYRNLLVVVR